MKCNFHVSDYLGHDIFLNLTYTHVSPMTLLGHMEASTEDVPPQSINLEKKIQLVTQLSSV